MKKRIALVVLGCLYACKHEKAPAAARFCNQDLSGVWVNASDTHFAYRLTDKGDNVRGKFFSREDDGGEAASTGEPILIEMQRTQEALQGVMKASGQSPSGRTCPIDFKLQVSSCEPDALQVIAETKVSVRDDCARARAEDGGEAPVRLVEYRWERPASAK
jgi:hypothetical protein